MNIVQPSLDIIMNLVFKTFLLFILLDYIWIYWIYWIWWSVFLLWDDLHQFLGLEALKKHEYRSDGSKKYFRIDELIWLFCVCIWRGMVVNYASLPGILPRIIIPKIWKLELRLVFVSLLEERFVFWDYKIIIFLDSNVS